MQNAAVLIANPDVEPLEADLVATVSDALADAGAGVTTPIWTAADRACDLTFDAINPEIARAVMATVVGDSAIDCAVVPKDSRRKRLLISDMDSTIVVNETLDDLAEYAGVGDEVAAITWQSMRGEVEFVDALERRVAMLQGLPAAMLEAAYQQVVLMPGARTLVRTMRHHGAHTVLVSGGFKFFTTRIARMIGFEEEEANELEIEHGRLTGRIVPPIINRDGKVNALLRHCAHHGIETAETLAVGDGANDLGMIERAGLGVAFQGKKIVAERAGARINHTDLTSLLYLQGYREEEFVV